MGDYFKEGDYIRCINTGETGRIVEVSTGYYRIRWDGKGYGATSWCLPSAIEHEEGLGTYNIPGAGVKHDAGKLQWSLLPFQYLRGVVRVLMHGAKKYSANNWRAGMPWSQPYNAVQRHLDAWMSGEDLDLETGENHLDHALCELLFLKAFVQDYPEKDDRYKQ